MSTVAAETTARNDRCIYVDKGELMGCGVELPQLALRMARVLDREIEFAEKHETAKLYELRRDHAAIVVGPWKECDRIPISIESYMHGQVIAKTPEMAIGIVARQVAAGEFGAETETRRAVRVSLMADIIAKWLDAQGFVAVDENGGKEFKADRESHTTIMVLGSLTEAEMINRIVAKQKPMEEALRKMMAGWGEKAAEAFKRKLEEARDEEDGWEQWVRAFRERNPDANAVDMDWLRRIGSIELRAEEPLFVVRTREGRRSVSDSIKMSEIALKLYQEWQTPMEFYGVSPYDALMSKGEGAPVQLIARHTTEMYSYL